MAFVRFAGSLQGATPQTATFASGPAAGDLLIACCWSNNATAMALTHGTWTAATNAVSPDGTRQFRMFYKISDGTETAVQIIGGGNVQVILFEYAGYQAALDGTPATNSQTTPSVNQWVTAALSTTYADSLVFILFGAFGATGTISTVTPATTRGVSSIGGPTGLEYLPAAALTNFTETINWTGTGNSILGAIVAAFKAVESPPLTGKTVTCTPGSITVTKTLSISLTGKAVTCTPGTPTTTGALSRTQTGATIAVTPGAIAVAATNALALSGATVTCTPGAATLHATSTSATSGMVVAVTPGTITTIGALTVALAGVVVVTTPGDPTLLGGVQKPSTVTVTVVPHERATVTVVGHLTATVTV